jgi:hypothetical protein
VERYGTRHRAALGITEQTDAVVVVVSEETGQVSLVERARILRNLDEAHLARALTGLLLPEARGTGLRFRLGHSVSLGGPRTSAPGALRGSLHPGSGSRDESADSVPDAATEAGR